MSWKKHFRRAKLSTSGELSPISGNKGGRLANPEFTNYGAILPEVYAGHPNRVERYSQLEAMDMDAEVNASLDIIAEFCTQEVKGNFFQFNFKEDPTETESKILKKELQTWCSLNKFDQRIFKIFRNVLKYGDQVFVRDPETFELMWVDMNQVVKVIVNESKGKKPEQYVIHDANVNFENLTVTQIAADTIYHTQPNSGVGVSGPYNSPLNPQSSGGRFTMGARDIAIEAEDIVHLSLSEGLDICWPFGKSILENIFKVYKQKELLEDAIIIYRVQRAPERRVFYIDVGSMPSHLAMAFVERIKNEIWQRRIPTQTGGGSSMMDATYSPLSINEDYFFPQCLSLNTKIKLLDNRDLTLDQIINEFEQGKENFVYSINPESKELEPGKIIWAGITRKNAKVLKITLDNNESVICTPDHRFIMRDGSEIEAQNLVIGSSVMPLNLVDGTTGKHQQAGKYLKYICPSNGKQKWVHTMVCPKVRPGKETEIHHIDFNSKNNNPSNLVEMETIKHRELHSKNGTYYLSKAWNTDESRQKLINGIKNYHKNATIDDKEMFRTRGIKNGSKTWINPISAQKVKNALRVTQKLVSESRKIRYSDGMYNRLVELFNDGHDSVIKMCRVLKTDNQFQIEYLKANTYTKRNKNTPSFICPTDKTLNSLVKEFGNYSSWGDFKKNYSYNHKIISIEELDYTIDTGDITVDSRNNCHNFALSCGIFVHNSADGRGSKVETLPGGIGLGEIDDLKWFTNRMARGLRIPSSYLPSGPDESSSIYQDGKVGTALIQENRFNQYCKRLQSLIIPVLDIEFKTFLKFRGVNIDSSLFDLKFNEPQNFASYRQAEMDSSKINTFTSLEQYKYLSRRFLLERYLGLTEEEILRNEELWREENKDTTDEAPDTNLRGVGISPGGLDMDLGSLGGEEMGGEGGEEMGGEMGGEMGAEPGAAPAGAAAAISNTAGPPPGP